MLFWRGKYKAYLQNNASRLVLTACSQDNVDEDDDDILLDDDFDEIDDVDDFEEVRPFMSHATGITHVQLFCGV